LDTGTVTAAPAGASIARDGLSFDGETVLLKSSEPLAEGDTNGSADWYLWDRKGGDPPPPPPNSPPTWSAPADRSRFDILPGTSTTFTVRASDPEGDPVNLSTRFFDGFGAPRTQPAFVTCNPDSDPGPAVSVSCRVAPSGIIISQVEFVATDSKGSASFPRRYLVSGTKLKYVALGDSYASGEGVSPFFKDGYDPNGQPKLNDCHRSSQAYATYVKLPGANSRPAYELSSSTTTPGTGDSFRKFGSESNVRSNGQTAWSFWACSGAVSANVTTNAQGEEQHAQLGNADVNPGADLVTVSIGGNDIKFAEVLESCGGLTSKNCLTTTIDGKPFAEGIRARIAALKPRLVQTYRAIKQRTFDARLLVLGYPQVFPATQAEQLCRSLKLYNFTSAEQNVLRGLAVELNTAIQTAAATAGATFVPVASYFAGHEVCGSAGEWINGVSLTDPPVTWPPSAVDDQTFHPNKFGQQAFSIIVNGAVGS
jgi:lysophospholipase L1-like esterase